MISDKLVVIKKDNVFDKGWALFTPCRGMQLKNTNYHEIKIDDVIKKITYADEIVLVLKEQCLPLKVVEELKWVDKYAKIYLIARDDSVVGRYEHINFENIRIDSNLPINFLIIKGKNEEDNYIISEGFQIADEFMVNLFLSDQKESKTDLLELEKAEEIFVCGEINKTYIDKLLSFCLKKNIKTYIVKSLTEFKKSIYDQYYDISADIVVADRVSAGICVKKSGKLYYASFVKGKLILIETRDFKSCIAGNTYLNLKCKEVLQGDEIPEEAHVFYEGTISRLKQEQCHVVERTVNIAEMSDFLEKRFDSSEVENHNQFSVIAKSVEYRFTLIPPIITEAFVYSDLYGLAQDLLRKWIDCFSFSLNSVRKDVSIFNGKESFLKMLDHIEESDRIVKDIIGEYSYSDYKTIFEERKKLLEIDNANLINYCFELNSAITGEIRDFQSEKIDQEIAGYRKTIREKEEYIRQNIHVLSNKRRIDLLKKKIQDLERIKANFSERQAENGDNSQKEFLVLCEDLIVGNIKESEADSVAAVLRQEISEKEKLYAFLKKWLKKIKNLLEDLINLLSVTSEIDVPEKYIVYEHKGKRYIVINSENEYYETLPLQQKYNLHCVVRR